MCDIGRHKLKLARALIALFLVVLSFIPMLTGTTHANAGGTLGGNAANCFVTPCTISTLNA